MENTPTGVTIHEIDEGVDTGPICFQKYVNFSKSCLTFKQTQTVLLEEVERLFICHFEDLLNKKYMAKIPTGAGSYHKAKDLPEWVQWDMKIELAIERYDNEILHSKGVK